MSQVRMRSRVSLSANSCDRVRDLFVSSSRAKPTAGYLTLNNQPLFLSNRMPATARNPPIDAPFKIGIALRSACNPKFAEIRESEGQNQHGGAANGHGSHGRSGRVIAGRRVTNGVTVCRDHGDCDRACVFGGTRGAPASGRGLKGEEGLHSIQTRTAGQVDRVNLIHAEPGWITFRPGTLTVSS